MKLRIASCLVAIALGASTASAQSIGVFGDNAGGSCNIAAPAGGAGSLFILATLGGAVSGGMTGAEFRVDNIPPSWFLNVTPNPAANLTLGAPFAAGGGANIAFPGCQIGGGGVVLLYSVSFFALSSETNRTLSVLRHTTPSNLNFQCPLLTLCDSPVFTKVCVNGGQAVINGPSCTVAVEQKSWSSVKALYTN